MNDQNFPIIEYKDNLTPYQNGVMHGETFKEGISELIEIRRTLMIEKSPHLKERIASLALEQAEKTKHFSPDLFSELEGIAAGASTSIEGLIILNNYTDFRDIALDDEGCSSVSLKAKDSLVSGQTWDMHSSAKNYVSIIKLPNNTHLFSLVGCLGMMGANKNGLFVGVNNVNTTDGRPGIIWPAFVRKALELSTYNEVKKLLLKTSFTGAHNYIISDGETSAHIEASPTNYGIASHLSLSDEKGDHDFIFHTNHCLTKELKKIEEPLSQNSTSNERYSLLERKLPLISDPESLKKLFQDHEGYPKSICGHFQSGKQDPSITCGGGVFCHKEKIFSVWRGCPSEDENYLEYSFKL